MIEVILGHDGFHVDCRGDLVGAWDEKAGATDTEERLDMYMTGREVMHGYVQQFLNGNDSFVDPDAPNAGAGAPGD